jgi:hypothetical protein
MKITTMALASFMALALLLPGLVKAGSLEPSAPPGPTMRTLDQVRSWIKVDPATRFVDNGDGTVLDRETGLTWTKDAHIPWGQGWPNEEEWGNAVNMAIQMTIANRKGWRLPTVEELASLIDPSRSNPALPAGHPFINVQSNIYWSSTTYEFNSDFAWGVSMADGSAFVNPYQKTGHYFNFWPVRGGK